MRGGKRCFPREPPFLSVITAQPRLSQRPLFSQASRAHGDVYVDALPNGGHRITHVFWASLG
jgi:hypothetical protein